MPVLTPESLDGMSLSDLCALLQLMKIQGLDIRIIQDALSAGLMKLYPIGH